MYKKKIIKKKINPRDLVIIHSSLKPKTYVRLYNPENAKSLVVQVKYKSPYSVFYNSVITKRISEELELDFENPYIELFEINTNNKFIAKKAKTFEEEKKVAEKVPVDGIKIDNLGTEIEKKEQTNLVQFSYSIKIADFYYKDSAENMIKRIKNETKLKDPIIEKLSNTKYRVLLGPFSDIKKIEESFNEMKSLNFENLEILKNV